MQTGNQIPHTGLKNLNEVRGAGLFLTEDVGSTTLTDKNDTVTKKFAKLLSSAALFIVRSVTQSVVNSGWIIS